MGRLVALAWIVTLVATITDGAEWSYTKETGPHHWHSLFPEACSGRKQSPIDIQSKETVYNARLNDFAIWYDPPRPTSKFFVVNNGHTVQINTDGDFFVANGGLPDIYRTLQFHFHWGHSNHHGSEHTIDGKASPIELHIVNFNSEKYQSITSAVIQPGGLAVLGVMFTISEDDNPALEPIVQALDMILDPDVSTDVELPAQAMRSFLPADTTRYYRYNGSLTTPSCFESVIWTVFADAQTISERQLKKFREVLLPKPSQHSHHRKRSHRHQNRKQRRAAEEVMEELGILGDEDKEMDLAVELELEQERKLELEAKLEQDIKLRLETKHDPKPTITDAEVHTYTPDNSGELETDDGNIHEVVHTSSSELDDHEEEMERIIVEIKQEFMVNNFRPVQKLNDRVVFRSFRTFDNQYKIEYQHSSAASTAGYARHLVQTVVASMVAVCVLLFSV